MEPVFTLVLCFSELYRRGQVDEEVEDFIKLLKEIDDEQGKNREELAHHVFTKKKDLPSTFKIEPYINLFDELKKELYRIKNQVKDDPERLATITLENETNIKETKKRKKRLIDQNSVF